MRILTYMVALLSSLVLSSQSRSELLHELEKLRSSTRVLYLAAHPDDENTRMIAWLANDLKVRTAYLSLTRGDGGQNLIGTELGADLGILRTQELMQARKIDGGEQFFTRAVDFGYSKTADETFDKWEKALILEDVVRVIRQFQPDVIITRFPPDHRAGHGHHTASAMLALEAFDAAADPKAFEGLSLAPWQVKRVYWNHSAWWEPKIDSLAANDPSYFTVDVGTYLPEIGLSCNELASFSRTQHKSQGFGVSVARGSQKEYLKLMKGDSPKEMGSTDFLAGIEQKWSRYQWPKGDELVAKLSEQWHHLNDEERLEALAELLSEAQAIQNEGQKAWFQAKVASIIQDLLGLEISLLANAEYAVQGEALKLQLGLINRSKIPVEILMDRKGEPFHSKYPGLQKADEENLTAKSEALPYNEEVEYTFTVPRLTESSQPYWLRDGYQNTFKVAQENLIGLPENIPLLKTFIAIKIDQNVLFLPVAARYRFSDRVEGEIERPLMAVPELVAEFSDPNLLFVGDQTRTINLKLRAFESGVYRIKLQAGNAQVKPSALELDLKAGEERNLDLAVTSPTERTQLSVIWQQERKEKELESLTEIDYPHIDKRMALKPAKVDLIPVDLQIQGTRIGYIVGAGDKVREALERMGYTVELLDEASFLNSDLSEYDAIIAGIRAYNTQAWLPAQHQKLMEYVQQGGNYIVQYNTRSRDLMSAELGPYPFEISRERVTEEDAEPEFLLADHPVFNQPNRITQVDFEGWVQERGLYFAGDWDERYQAPIGWHDKAEPRRDGGLIIASYGEGNFVYTGISFFRELPAGVPGAYRLLANLIAL